jgi:hypothetical protein
VSLSSIIEFAFLCITSVPPSVVFGGVITLWTIIALVHLTEVWANHAPVMTTMTKPPRPR